MNTHYDSSKEARFSTNTEDGESEDLELQNMADRYKADAPQVKYTNKSLSPSKGEEK